MRAHKILHYNSSNKLHDPHSYEPNFCNSLWKPEKFKTSTEFEPCAREILVSRGHRFKPVDTAILVWIICDTGVARSRVQTPLTSWIFQITYICSCKNCVHNSYCEDHSLFDFTSVVEYMIYYFIIRITFNDRSQYYSYFKGE